MEEGDPHHTCLKRSVQTAAIQSKPDQAPPDNYQLERLGVLSEVEPEVPSVKIAKVIDFFDHVKQSTDDGKRLPTWRGELYFELHRGVSTHRPPGKVIDTDAKPADIHKPGEHQEGKSDNGKALARCRILRDTCLVGFR
jgi:hypothetical protein